MLRACLQNSKHRLARYNGRVSFIIRDFRPSDFEALWRIDQECFPAGISYSRAELKAYMRHLGSFTLLAVGNGTTEEKRSHSPEDYDDKDKNKKMSVAAALGDGSLAGFIVGEAGADRSGHIITIDVVSAARRSGVGSLLLRAAEDRLQSAHCRSIELETAVDNTSALAFYKRHGYSVTRTFPRYYSNGVDALVLEKPLIQK